MPNSFAIIDQAARVSSQRRVDLPFADSALCQAGGNWLAALLDLPWLGPYTAAPTPNVWP